MAFVQKVACKAAVGHFGLNRGLAVISPADTRPFKAQTVKAVVIVGGIVHYAAAKLNIMLDGKRLNIPLGQSFSEMDMFQMLKFCYSKYVAHGICAE